jgi:hypothetical protein
MYGGNSYDTAIAGKKGKVGRGKERRKEGRVVGYFEISRGGLL